MSWLLCSHPQRHLLSLLLPNLESVSDPMAGSPLPSQHPVAPPGILPKILMSWLSLTYALGWVGAGEVIGLDPPPPSH